MLGRFSGIVLAAVLVVAFAAATPARAAVDPLTCTGYPEARSFVEAQSWWEPSAGQTGPDRGHVHIGACVPAPGTTVRGTVGVDYRVLLHYNPGTVFHITSRLKDSSGEFNVQTKSVSFTCFGLACEAWFHVDYDTTRLPYDGVARFSVQASTSEPGSEEMFPVIRFPARVANGKTVSNYSGAVWSGISWYTNAGYTIATVKTGVPTLPVAGTWTPVVAFSQIDSFEAAPDGSSLSDNVTHYLVTVDPSFHATPPYPGVVQVDANTSCAAGKTRCNGPQSLAVAIDTTRLANGPHKLFVQSQATDLFLGDTNRGALVVPFTVAN